MQYNILITLFKILNIFLLYILCKIVKTLSKCPGDYLCVGIFGSHISRLYRYYSGIYDIW